MLKAVVKDVNYRDQNLEYTVVYTDNLRYSKAHIADGKLIIRLSKFANLEVENKLLSKSISRYYQYKKYYFDISKDSFFLFGEKVFWNIVSTPFSSYIKIANQNNELMSLISLKNSFWVLQKNDPIKSNELVVNSINKWIKKLLIQKLETFQTEISTFYKTYNSKIVIFNKDRTWGTNYITKKTISYAFNCYILSNYYLKFIVAHEVVHNLVRGHSSTFYAKLNLMYPEYKKIDQDLDQLIFDFNRK